MDSLTHNDFAAFFRAVWGFDPFPWQQDLLQRLVTGTDSCRKYSDEPGQWPDVLDLPTGSGKTAALDIAIFHLALEAAKRISRRAPLRIAFVVDRRLIVDDAFARAERLCESLGWSLLNDKDAKELEARRADLAETIRRVRAEPVVTHASLQLRGLAGPDQPPLIARSLRGGTPREDDWSRTPVQPTILCSTVDQVGSRLLFRGYGVSDRMKPIHAGLLGSDCLILLDEAHLSEPFRQTLDAIKRLRAPDAAPFGFAVLSATPTVAGKRLFELGAEDYSNPILAARMRASKPARLVEITGKRGVDSESRRLEVICAEAKIALANLKNNIANPALGIVVNRVARARAIFEQLKQELGPRIVKLIIGPARTVDRDRRTQELAPIRTGQSKLRSAMTDALVVVATQTVEAGVDIDFDGLITEAAALDALRQRFGRLNRAGRDIAVEAIIVADKDDISSKADDPVYGDRIAKSWIKLQQLAAEADGVVDFGIESFRGQINQEEAGALATRTANAPILLPTYTDLWSHTSPIPNADPDVALFLHGADRSPATVQIVWRADLDEKRDFRPVVEYEEAARARLIELFKLVPPRAAEAVEVPLWAARAWLDRTATKQANFSDAAERNPEANNDRRTGRCAFRWAGEDSERTQVVQASALRNGDLIVVPAEYGGCDEWGWNPSSNKLVIDVAEKAAWPYRAHRFAVRVTPQLIAQGFQKERVEKQLFTTAANASTGDLEAILAAHRDDRATSLLDAIRNLDLPGELKISLQALTNARSRRLERVFSYESRVEEVPGGVVFVAVRGIAAPDTSISDAAPKDGIAFAALPATESEDLGAASDKAVPLKEHCEEVRAWAESFAVRAGLTQSLGDDVALAAFLHDQGKADPRFQSFLAGGDPYGPDTSEPLAKSGQARLPPGAWTRAGLPDSWRHEALSVRLALLHPDFAKANNRALVLWLIGTHHGYGRPLFPHADPLDSRQQRIELPGELGGVLTLERAPGPQSLTFNFEGRDWVQLFELLKEKYGSWGLARLETFVRLADHRASEETSSHAGHPYKEAAE